MTADMLALAGSLLGCDAPIPSPMTVIETVNGADVARETSIAMPCDSCPACLSRRLVP